MLIDIAVVAALLVQIAFVVVCGIWLVWWLLTLHAARQRNVANHNYNAHWTGLPVTIVTLAVSTVMLSWTNNLFRTIYLRMVTDVRWLPFCILLDDIILAAVSQLSAFCKIALLFLFEEIRHYILSSTEQEFRYHRRKLRVLFWIIFALTSVFAFFPLMSMITLAIPSNKETPQILIFLYFAVTDVVMGSSFELYGIFLLHSAFSKTIFHYSLVSQHVTADDSGGHIISSNSTGNPGGGNFTPDVFRDAAQYAHGSINPMPVRNKLPESIRIAFKHWATWTGSVCIAFGVLFYFVPAAVRLLNVFVPSRLETLLLVTEEALFFHSALFAMFVMFAINRRRDPISEDFRHSQL